MTEPQDDSVSRPANFDEEWAQMSRRLIRTLMARRDIYDYKELADRLQEIGVEVKAESISSKIRRGTFSMKFFMQVCKALNVKNVNIDWDDQ